VENKKTLYIFTRDPMAPKACCTIIAKLLQTSLFEKLNQEFQIEFPDLTIEFA
jgi:hypothetical protein